MFKHFLYDAVGLVAKFHSWFLALNNDSQLHLTDKQLHFLIIGIVGMAIFFIVDPIIRNLARKGKIGAVSWAYSLTLIIGLAFAIEIGQHVTGTGLMEFSDIVFGVVGFLVLHLVWVLLKGLITAVSRLFHKKKD